MRRLSYQIDKIVDQAGLVRAWKTEYYLGTGRGPFMKTYSFVTIWRVEAPIESVWKEIYHSKDWPAWWKGVESVNEVRKGDETGVGSVHRFTWKSKLPYRLSFDMETVRIEPPRLLEGIAIGELQGRGQWQLSTEGSATIVRYDWNVETTKRWMNLLSPIARPLFEWNHNVVMSWGATGLSEKLGVSVVAEKH